MYSQQCPWKGEVHKLLHNRLMQFHTETCRKLSISWMKYSTRKLHGNHTRYRRQKKWDYDEQESILRPLAFLANKIIIPLPCPKIRLSTFLNAFESHKWFSVKLLTEVGITTTHNIRHGKSITILYFLNNCTNR